MGEKRLRGIETADVEDGQAISDKRPAVDDRTQRHSLRKGDNLRRSGVQHRHHLRVRLVDFVVDRKPLGVGAGLRHVPLDDVLVGYRTWSRAGCDEIAVGIARIPKADMARRSKDA
jgi:hypothetical protein